MGLADKLSRRRQCPVCRTQINTRLRATCLLCKICDTYLEFVEADDRLVAMDPATVSPRHTFAAALPWTDVGFGVQFPGGLVHPMVQLTDKMLNKREGVRVLEAKWPACCCVCGGPATRAERLGRTVLIPRALGIFNVGTKQLVLTADGVPHCSNHSGGFLFDRVLFDSHDTDGDSSFGILFRWLSYRNEFRKMNPWPWSKF